MSELEEIVRRSAALLAAIERAEEHIDRIIQEQAARRRATAEAAQKAVEACDKVLADLKRA